MPEGDAELPDETLPDEAEEEDESDTSPCGILADVLRAPVESLPGDPPQSR